MEKWWKNHADKSGDPEWHQWVDRFGELMHIKMLEWKDEHTNQVDGKRVFGLSKAGGCTRDIALGLLGFKGEDVSGSSRFTFWLGHAVEIAALATLEAAGYPLIETQQECILLDKSGRPIAQSKSDGVVKILGIPTIVSVKSAAYKMSGQQKGKWIRRGFAEYPFVGFRMANPSGYVQLQCELAASGFKQGLALVAAKDIVKVFEKDEYLGEKGNGSLTFYAEIIKPEIETSELATDILSEQMNYVDKGSAGPAMYFAKNTSQYVELEKAKVIPSNVWGGKNKELTGSFNPCGGCAKVEVCGEQD
jgi:hypothetical protein